MFHRIDPELAHRNHHHPLPSSSHMLNQCSRMYGVAAWLIMNNIDNNTANDCFLNDHQELDSFLMFSSLVVATLVCTVHI